MSEGERQALAIRLYDDWQETDTSDSLEIYCYQQGYADAMEEVYRLFKSMQGSLATHVLEFEDELLKLKEQK